MQQTIANAAIILALTACGTISLAGDIPKINSRKPPGPAPKGMVWVPGGWFWMGEEPERIGKLFRNGKVQPPSDTGPIHKVYVDGFWMDKTEVTNEQWAEFVKATSYKTVAEKKPRLEDFKATLAAAPKEVRAELMKELEKPFSIVFFNPKPGTFDLRSHQGWWKLSQGADWKHPEGPKSTIKGREKHPAVHISYEDALAYSKWAKKRLPTEAEWEFAARGGLNRKLYCWGDDLLPENRIAGPAILVRAVGQSLPAGCRSVRFASALFHVPEPRWYANVWQGRFPVLNSEQDGFALTAPVGSYPPNGYGLHDMSGNAWEWCADWYRADYYKKSPKKNPKGPKSGFDDAEPGVPKRVQRGGSFLCADNYCIRYLAAARGKGEPTSAQNHCGFRCVMDAK